MSGEITNIFQEIFNRGWNQLSDRLTGPMNVRLIVTPTVVLILAIKAGWKDAREGQPPFLWNAFSKPEERKAIFNLAWKPIKKVILVAMILDFIYQIYVIRAYLIIQSLILVAILAVIPYVLLRGVTTRLLSVVYKK